MSPGGKVTFCRKANFFGRQKPLSAASQRFFSLQNVLVSAASIFFGGRMFWRPPLIGRRKPSVAAVSRHFGGKMICRAASSDFRPPNGGRRQNFSFGGKVFWRPLSFGRRKNLAVAIRRYFKGKMI